MSKIKGTSFDFSKLGSWNDYESWWYHYMCPQTTWKTKASLMLLD